MQTIGRIRDQKTEHGFQSGDPYLDPQDGRIDLQVIGQLMAARVQAGTSQELVILDYNAGIS